MEIVTLLLEVGKLLLERLNINLRRKYIEELNEAENNLRLLYAVDYMLRDHAAIDFWNFKLRQSLRNIAADVRAANA